MAAITKNKKEEKDRKEKEEKIVFKAILTFQEEMGISDDDLGRILSKDRSTIHRWKAESRIPGVLSDKHLREAISHFIAIYRSLGAMFINKNDRKLWMTTDHPDFANNTPLDVIEESFEGIINLRRYLDYIRGRGA